MGQSLTIAVIGGDKRELFLAEFLVSQGFEVRLCGHEKYHALPAPNFIDPIEAAEMADAVIMPLAGLKENFSPNCPFSDSPPKVGADFFAALRPNTPVFVGWAREELKALAGNVSIIEVAEDDELAILNSIPTAEGAIAVAMDNSPITIHGSNAMVIGFGRCAISLARMLMGVGASVTVAARKSSDLARAFEMGFKTCLVSNLSNEVENMDFIFNSVPAMVVSESVLTQAKSCQLIVDIASGKGGIDFDAASKLGIKSIQALGLPGKVAPVTAGKILTKVYPRLFEQYGVHRR